MRKRERKKEREVVERERDHCERKEREGKQVRKK